jgi:hypothetical protein
LFRHGFRFALAGIVIACSLPLLAISFLIAALGTAGAAALACFRRPRQTIGLDAPPSWSADQFAFENAVQAYEDLIDEHAGRRT